MKRLMRFAMGMMIGGMGAMSALAGEASTSASATNGWWTHGSAAATANYNGNSGLGIARTRTDNGDAVNIARGLAVGFDEDGLDVSFSHALAPKSGPAYAGTFNMSIGLDGQVSGSYGGSIAQGGMARTAEAGGMTRSNRFGGTSVAHAGGNTAGGGKVDARTQSYNRPAPLVSSRLSPLTGGRGRPVTIVRSPYRR